MSRIVQYTASYFIFASIHAMILHREEKKKQQFYVSDKNDISLQRSQVHHYILDSQGAIFAPVFCSWIVTLYCCLTSCMLMPHHSIDCTKTSLSSLNAAQTRCISNTVSNWTVSLPLIVAEAGVKLSAASLNKTMNSKLRSTDILRLFRVGFFYITIKT